MLDPRLSIIEERLSGIDRIIVVSSGKGGVGKSIIASTLALILSRKGFEVGLLDLDFTSPTTHIVLGVRNLQPIEDKGLIPPEVYGIKYMSLVFYLGDQISPLRGRDLSNAFIEILTITRWNNLDFLIIDMPPGISDLMLDVLKCIKRANFLIVTTSSKMAFETVRKLLLLLRDLMLPVVGVIENMKLDDSEYIKREVEALGENFLGEIYFDKNLENALGSVRDLLKTDFAKEIERIILKINKNFKS